MSGTTDTVTGSIVAYLRDNPLAGLRRPLRGAPRSTWTLVPPLALAGTLVAGWAGLLEPERPTVVEAVGLPILLLVAPALTEELFHRGVLLPRSLLTATAGRRFAFVTLSTAVYTASHLIGPALGIEALRPFADPRLLAVVAMLGYATGYAYLRSGTLRAPILIHWVVVVVWNLFLGGTH